MLEMVSSPILLLFWYWGGDREAAEVALTTTGNRFFAKSKKLWREPSHGLSAKNSFFTLGEEFFAESKQAGSR
jgi:hypothetical protein